ncbi:MAG: C-terminal target protein [Bacteroidetes bacterium]|nr:C-terminal target protein [Bacteroidota bacterium]
MKKIITICVISLLVSFHSYSTNYVSAGAGPAAWNSSTSWLPAGIPTGTDNVTIAAGHTITLSVTTPCNNLTVNGTLKGASGMVLNIKGNYIVNGVENGTGAIQFINSPGVFTISGTGTFSPTISYTFAVSSVRTISAGTTIVKSGATAIAGNASVTNLGTLTLGTVNTAPGAAFINSSTGVLTLTVVGFMSGRSFTANAVGNTVNAKYPTGAIPTTVSGYYNLGIINAAAGIKTLPAATIVANNLTINTLNTLNSNGFDLSVGGNWTNNGTFTPGTNTVFLTGTGAQAIGGTSAIAFYNLTKNAAGTATLAGNATVSNLLNISSGILDASTFGLSGTGGLTMTGGELRVGKLTTVPELTGTYTLTTGKVTFSGAGAQTIKSGITYFNVDVTGSGTKTLAGMLAVNGSLSISSTLDASAGNFGINLQGNWTNNGTFTPQGGTVTFLGTGAQSIAGTATTFENLIINNSAGVNIASGTYNLNDAITLAGGTFNTGGRTFVMNSTASKTARIAPITGSGAIAGNFTIQRFITTRDTTWADFSSPVQSSTFGDWANEFPAIYYGYSPPNQYPTQYTYDETADDFSPVTSAATALTPGKGFEVFMAGDFSYSNLPNTTINTIGVPNQGNQDLSGLLSFNNAGSNLVGNPFASSISWTSVLAASAGILNTYDVYDYTTGNYSTHGAGTEIGATQGFWVYTTTSSPHFRILETAKTTSSNSSIKAVVAEPYFTLKLSGNDAGNTYSHVLKVAATDVSSDGWDDNDHPYRKSPNKLAPGIYSVIDAKKSVINSFSLSNDSYSMPIQTTAGISGSYKITAAGFENISDYSCIKLEDKLLNKTVDLTAVNSYSFQLNVGDNSDRFIVHFSKNADCKSVAVAKSDMSANFENNVTVLPTAEGNSIAFNLSETTPATITVTNIMGQTIVEGIAVDAQTQTVNVALPSDFSGMYIIKIASSKGVITKKYVRK